METKFKIGDRVKFKTKFLQEIKMPLDENTWKDKGTVIRVEQTENYTYVKVNWDLNGIKGTLGNKIQKIK
jgi:hypothetical protein